SATFTVTASPGERLQFETMFVQSNDWFYAFGGGGLALFNGDTPVSGDVTAQVVLYDAGTEEDTAPGTGPNQKPAQDPVAMNVGPADDNLAVRLASTSGFTIPATASVIRVTVTPQP
ncbi:MAG: spondin domain-containing protein, partial [Gemmatimonadaceae bacterium]